MIVGTKDVGELFSVFHDGEVLRHRVAGNDLALDIQIAYLAERVNPAYTTFQLVLHGVVDPRFKTWPNNAIEAPAILRNLAEIFGQTLDILSGEADGGRLTIVFNQPSAGLPYCGGELSLEATGATVTDESGKEYELDELKGICKDYWEAWATRNAQA